MIKEYLVREMSDTLDRKLNMESRIRENSASINNLDKHISIIRKDINESDSVLCPGAAETMDQKKIKELTEERKKLLLDNESLKSLCSDLETRLAELQQIYDYSNKAEQYSNMEKYGINFSEDETETSHLQMLEIQEEERGRIARDLHDSVVQNLTNIVHKVEFVSKVMDKDEIKAKLELKTIEKNVRDVISDMRDVIYNLRPMSFDDIGIQTTIERELSRLQNISGIKFNYKTTGKPYKVDSVIEITLFRIIQEACNNSIRHSGATEISVVIHFKKKMISLEIHDNGCGFDFKKVSATKKHEKTGFGISMMKERVFLLSGTIKCESKPGEGTAIFVDVPI
ncbi:MAG: hypothetical protein E7241_05325 [Lachnospiraceae bacterium]|nr:hypothetical protein [Lachnospiraceae bacterium]